MDVGLNPVVNVIGSDGDFLQGRGTPNREYATVFWPF